MTKRKTGSSKKTGSRRPRPSRTKHPIVKALAGTAILVAVVLLAAAVTHYIIFRRPSGPRPNKTTDKAAAVYKVPAFEIYPKKEIPAKHIKRPMKKPFPTVAIIIDDIGYHRHLEEKLILLDKNMTFSILPYSPHRKEILRFARKEGAETMLHLPMEPNEYPQADPGPGALLSTMTPDALIHQLVKHLKAVPDA